MYTQGIISKKNNHDLHVLLGCVFNGLVQLSVVQFRPPYAAGRCLQRPRLPASASICSWDPSLVYWFSSFVFNASFCLNLFLGSFACFLFNYLLLLSTFKYLYLGSFACPYMGVVCVCVCRYVHVCACACMCVHVRACACMCVHVRACACMCMHVRACACMCRHRHIV